MSNKKSHIQILDEIASEAEQLVQALNAITGYSSENPNPLTVKMTRLLDEARENNHE